jgi:putative DNA primase/helicase
MLPAPDPMLVATRATPLPILGSPLDILPSDSEENIASIFAGRHADSLRYVDAWGAWFLWDGCRWRKDDTLQAFSLARAVCRDLASGMSAREAKPVASAKTVSAVERMAKADRLIAATADQWDADPMLLNTPGGVVDLRTGQMRPANAADYMTKMTAVAPGGDCPLWQSFLGKVTGGDDGLVEFLQRALGYSLTGVTSEHALFFLYGTGANGKSVLLSTAAGILYDYHTTAPIQTFTASQNERHPTDLAGLRGARLVTATETESGQRWDEAKIKALTGGDKIAARFMRQDFFEFTPQFKLVIAGNHKPTIRSVDEAMRRRINLVPFTVTIPATERDHALGEKLKAEWPGILAWLIEGCRQWQSVGLRAPESVINATAHYLAAEDVTATWLDERCERDPAAWVASGALFVDWSVWAEANGERAGSQKAFSQGMEDRGFEQRKFQGKRGFSGLKLRH